jgi:hypothetical protein
VNRVIIFFVALLFESFYISNLWTRVSVLVISIVVAVLLIWRIVIRASHQSVTYYWGLWWYAMVALCHVCRGQLRRLRYSARTTVELLRNLFHSYAPNDAGSVHSLDIPRGGVGRV